MANSKFVLIFLMMCVFALMPTYQTAPTNLRGIPPKDVQLYQKDNFQCLDGSQTIKSSNINDNYCDCADGSDEPGTSACPKGRFYCSNRGFEPLTLFSSRVNDGVCDCCDGTDEYDSRVKCPNNCREQGKQIMGQRRELLNTIEAGLVVRDTMVEKARQIRQDKERERDRIKQEIQSLEAQLTTSQATKVQAEREEDAAKDLKSQLEAKYRPSTAPTPEGSTDNNNNNDAKVEVQADIEDEDEEEIALRVERERNQPTPPALEVETLEVTPYPEEVRQQIEQAEKTIENAERARNEFRSVESQISSKQSEIDAINKLLDADYGPDSVFLALKGQSYAVSDVKYSYNFKPFEEVVQDGHTNMGHWQGEWVSGSEYTKQKYTGGTRCWNGPDRSVEVELICGKTEALLGVEEPNKCEYKMRFASPVVCSRKQANELKTLLGEGVEEVLNKKGGEWIV